MKQAELPVARRGNVAAADRAMVARELQRLKAEKLRAFAAAPMLVALLCRLLCLMPWDRFGLGTVPHHVY